MENTKVSSHHIYIMYLVFISITVVSAFEKTLEGKRAPCQNEGEPVAVDDIDKHRCFSCICKNGFVECSNDCPRIDDCYMIVQDGCCKKCQGCKYKNGTFQSHTEWTDPENACVVLRCEAGVVTESNLHCHTPCANPLPPEPGKCCPTCPECKINGQIASDDRDVISDDPCLKCRCSRGRMICSKKACPVLQCSITRRYHPPGECCPRCEGTRALMRTQHTCTLQNSFRREGEHFTMEDKCTTCVCKNETSICRRHACPILDCAPDLQKAVPGDCCKKCIMPEEVRTQCHYGGNDYEDGQSWKLDACSSCKCQRGMPSCAMTKCNVTQPCAPGTRKVKVPGECCSKCEEVEGVCTVFGDPHYKTFDGKMYNFKGVGKYQLTADCENNTFSVRVANALSDQMSSPSTKRVGVKYGDIRINLQQKGRVKFNGLRIKLPYKSDGKVHIQKVHENIEVTLQNGVKLFWNGKSFLEVTVPAAYKNKLCGLCGNFNRNIQDDLKTKRGRIVRENEILPFGASWCVGKPYDCNKKVSRACTTRHQPEKNRCKYLTSGDVFGGCDSKLNYSKYYKACKMDMCNCPKGGCYCESLMAYARECERLGVKLPNWQRDTMCEAKSSRKNRTQKLQQRSKPKSPNENWLRLMQKRNITGYFRSPIPIH